MWFGIFQFSTVVVERGLTDLPYISEACVIGVPNHETGQLCAAVVRLRCGKMPPGETPLGVIRSDLARTLPPFMLPVLLRILQDGEDLPRTISGKPIKRNILKDYFGIMDGTPAQRVPAGIQQWAVPRRADGEYKPWDWCGLQR